MLATLSAFLAGHGIRGGHFSGIGAVSYAELASYDTREKKYRSRKFHGDLEVTSLTGNIAVAEGKPFMHSHIVLGMPDFSAVSGHLVEATVSITLEISLTDTGTAVERKQDRHTGLKLMDM